MSKGEYALLQDVIMDADFPDLDLALRRGRHIDRDDAAWYSLLTDAQELLEPFYRRYGCELIHKTDGYFYLLPTGDKVSRKQLAATDMLVGQALALLYLDPAAVERGGVVSQEEVVSQLSAVLGSDALIGVFSPGKRKVKDERIAQRNVRQRVGEAVRRLAALGFVELSEENAVRLRAALLRFAEPVRGLSEPAEALAKLVAQGEVALAPDEPGEGSSEQDDAADGGEEEPDRTTLVGVPAPLDSAAAEPVAGADGGLAVAAQGAGDGDAAEAALSRSGVSDEDAVVAADAGEAVGGEVAMGSASGVDDPEPGEDLAAASGGGAVDAFASDEAAPTVYEGDATVAADPEHAGGLAAEGAARADAAGEAASSSDQATTLSRTEADAPAQRIDDTLAGIGAPGLDDDKDSIDRADGGEAERSAVVRKPRARTSDDDLDWADILVPEPDAEDGS